MLQKGKHGDLECCEATEGWRGRLGDEPQVSVRGMLGPRIIQFGQGSIEVKSGPRTRRTKQCELWKRNCQHEVQRRTVNVKYREGQSDIIKGLQTIERNRPTSALVQVDFVDYVEWCRAWSFAQPTIITELKDVELGALCKLKERVMEVRTS